MLRERRGRQRERQKETDRHQSERETTIISYILVCALTGD